MRIAYVNLWNGFEKDSFIMTRILQEEIPNCDIDVGLMSGKKYDLVISIMVPMVGHQTYADMTKVDSKKLWFTGESYDLLTTTPGCDAYIGFDHKEDMPTNLTYMRFPLYEIYHLEHLHRYKCSSYEELRAKFYSLNPQKKFSAVVSNPNNPLRTSLLNILVSNGLCDSGGRVANNMGDIGWSFDAKMNLAANCMFAIAFENKVKRGYITEKIYEAFMVGAVPYYWGASDVIDEFNPDAYHIFDSSTEEKANQSLQKMINILRDQQLFEKMRSVDPFTGFRSEAYIKNGKDLLKTFIMNLVESK